MYKTLLVLSLAVLCCRSQLDIPRKISAQVQPIARTLAIPTRTATLGQIAGQVVSQPAWSVAQPAWSVAQPAWSVAQAQLPLNIQKIRTQEVLPIQDLGVVNPGPQVVQVRSDQEPVLVHFQSQSAPVHVETSHVPSPPGETTVTQSQDEPHTVIHEIIRPVIQEVREIIQPYRRITQEIRPVKEEVHTEVAAGGAAQAAVASAPVVAAPAPVAVAAPSQVTVAAPQTAVFGAVAAPAPIAGSYVPGSYIQQFIQQLGLRGSQTNLVAARPQINIAATDLETSEPIASEAAVVRRSGALTRPKVVGNGAASITRKYVEY